MSEVEVPMRRVRVSDIVWDTEGSRAAAKALPRELIVELQADDSDDVESLTERAIRECSDGTGWTILDCRVQILSSGNPSDQSR